jgi:hypothetical protein
MRAIRHEEAPLKMIRFMRQLVVVAMLGIVSVGAFAQRKDQDKRPPKEPAKVIENRKDNRPPPNNNRPKNNDNRKKP